MRQRTIGKACDPLFCSFSTPDMSGIIDMECTLACRPLKCSPCWRSRKLHSSYCLNISVQTKLISYPGHYFLLNFNSLCNAQHLENVSLNMILDWFTVVERMDWWDRLQILWLMEGEELLVSLLSLCTVGNIESAIRYSHLPTLWKLYNQILYTLKIFLTWHIWINISSREPTLVIVFITVQHYL